MRSLCCMIVAFNCLSGCESDRSLTDYHIESDQQMVEDLPAILPANEYRDGVFAVPNTEAWFRLAAEHELVGKSIDAAIDVYGNDYLISEPLDVRRPRMYYKLAGSHSWGVYGVIVLDDQLNIVEVTLDPAN